LLCAVWASVLRAIELRYPSATCPLDRHLYMAYLRGVHLHRRRIACVSRLNHDLRLRSGLRLLRQIWLRHGRGVLLARGSRYRGLWANLLGLRLRIPLRRRHWNLHRRVLGRIAILRVSMWLLLRRRVRDVLAVRVGRRPVVVSRVHVEDQVGGVTGGRYKGAGVALRRMRGHESGE
jgi:hypothetical protein